MKSPSDPTELAKLGFRRFAAAVLYHFYELQPTDNLVEFIFGKVDRLIAFFNVIPACDKVIPATTEIKDGITSFVEETTIHIPARREPFMWAARVCGQWFVCKPHGVPQHIDHNMWVKVFEHWNNPGYTMLANEQGGWYVSDLDPKKGGVL